MDASPAYLLDYGQIKDRIMAMDHKLLLPSTGRVGYTASEDSVTAQWTDFGHKNTIQVSRCMVQILPIAETSSELLAQYLAESFADVPNITSVEAIVSETPNTSARCTWNR